MCKVLLNPMASGADVKGLEPQHSQTRLSSGVALGPHEVLAGSVSVALQTNAPKPRSHSTLGGRTGMSPSARRDPPRSLRRADDGVAARNRPRDAVGGERPEQAQYGAARRTASAGRWLCQQYPHSASSAPVTHASNGPVRARGLKRKLRNLATTERPGRLPENGPDASSELLTRVPGVPPLNCAPRNTGGSGRRG